MKKAIYGYGGHAREVAQQIAEDLTFFAGDEYQNDFTKPISLFDPEEYSLMIAIGDCKVRKKIVGSLSKETKYFTFIHPTALILDNNIEIGEGSFIGAYSILTTNIQIGKHAILNRGNQIGHDTKCGNYLSMMPGAIISGNCILDDCIYVGNNSSIREKINITNNVIIGLNSGVVKDIEISGVYGGIPARRIK